MAISDTFGLKRLAFLIGSWSGVGEGFGTTSEVEHTYQYVLQDKFIHSKTKSISRGENGDIIDVHEDWGFYSFDPDRGAIILREFYSEGYVNEYVMDIVSGDDELLTFTSQRTEGTGGMMVRLRLKLISENEYEMYLDLAQPGEEFKVCQIVKMVRDY